MAILQAKVLGLFTTWLPHRHAGGCHQSLAYHSPEENRIDRAGRLSTFASAATRVRQGVRRGWLRRAVDLDDVTVRIKEEELGVTGRAVATDKNTHRVVLRRVFAKTAGSQRGESVVEIISAESKMAIVVINVAGPEGAERMNGQMQLQGAGVEPSADGLEGRPFHDCEAQQLLIESERPREIGDDDINVVERKLSHGRR
jgi:hypothetical protein